MVDISFFPYYDDSMVQKSKTKERKEKKNHGKSLSHIYPLPAAENSRRNEGTGNRLLRNFYHIDCRRRVY